MPETAPAKLKTRAQEDLKLAVKNISAMGGEDDDVKANYIRRVKDFPALVMTVGLAQALAFSREKDRKATGLGKAHKLLQQHVAAILNKPDALVAVQQAGALEYMHMTRRVLAAWVYYRRFAVSILDPDDKLKAKGVDNETGS